MYSPKQRLVSEKFVLRDVQSKKTKKNEDYYILDLIGKDGHINGMVWSDKLAMCEPLKIGTVIAVDGLAV
jgi:23S rRNA maturation-related 3'-5' exoribonuclease YhaM